MSFTAASRVVPELFSFVSTDVMGMAFTTTVPSSNAWPAANVALFVPFSVVQPVTVLEGWAACGSTGGGNFDIGIYDTAGNRLTSSGATARTATTTVNTTGMTNLDLFPDTWYYMAMSADGTNNYIAGIIGAGFYEAMGVCEATSAYTLPNPATLARTTRAYLPLFGLNLQSTGVS